MEDFNRNTSDNELGNLAQSARRTSLSRARIILFVIGTLTLVAHIAIYIAAEKIVEDQIRKEIAAHPGLQINPIAVKQAQESGVSALRTGGVIFGAVGIVFLSLGIFIYRAPVVCTVTGMVLYLSGWAIDVALAAINGEPEDIPKALLSGIILKVIIIIALSKAIQSAVAYQEEEKQLRASRHRDDDFRFESNE